MRNYHSERVRCLLARGGIALATTLLLLCATGWRGDRSTDSDVIQPTIVITATTTEMTTTFTSTATTSTTTTSTTTTSETTTTVQTIVPMATTTYAQTTEPEAVTEPELVVTETLDLPITEQEFILLANLISHEAGCSWITEYERACIVAAVMNRVYDPRFPNTIDAVVHQPYQMYDVPYYRIDYSGIGYESIDNAIYAYFGGKYDCGNINSWSGNGYNNTFYCQ